MERNIAKEKVRSQLGGSVGKAFVTLPDDLSSAPDTHMVGENAQVHLANNSSR